MARVVKTASTRMITIAALARRKGRREERKQVMYSGWLCWGIRIWLAIMLSVVVLVMVLLIDHIMMMLIVVIMII